jgi:hypothetical protein
VSDDARTFLTLALLSVFIAPSLYWFPAGLPFLRLGETIFHEDFPVRAFSRFRALLLREWPQQVERLNAARRTATDFYLRHIVGAREYGVAVPCLRFPLLLEDSGARRQLLEGRGKRLGISGMYPGSVGAIRQLAHRLEGRRFPEAERIAASLVTLPTHPMLSGRDLTKISEAVNAAFGRVSAYPVGVPAGQPRMR